MKQMFIPLWMAIALILGGCAAQPRNAAKPYTNAEIKQFALKFLGSSSLSSDRYEGYRRALARP